MFQVLKADDPRKLWDQIKSGNVPTVRDAAATRKASKPQKGRPAKRPFRYKATITKAWMELLDA